MRGRALVVAVLLVLGGCTGGGDDDAACPTGERTVQYADHPGTDPALTSLDLYLPEQCGQRPMVVWVHGGGWQNGDKGEFMEDKVPLFTGAGYVFASVNYRLTDPAAAEPLRWPVHDDDTADAVAWLVAHAGELGADPDRVAVLGHSAGGGIVAALATDDRYLGRHDLPVAAITCAGSMDGEGYDVVAGATTSPPEYHPTYLDAFGPDPDVWAAASPVRHVAAGTGIPPFFVAARGSDWRVEMHVEFVAALRQAGVAVTVLDSRQLEHADLTTAVGAPDDTVVTPALMAFLAGCFD